MGFLRGRRERKAPDQVATLVAQFATAWEAGDHDACEDTALELNKLHIWQLPDEAIDPETVITGANALAAYALWAFDAIDEDREDAPEYLTGTQAADDAWSLIHHLPDKRLTGSDDLLDPDDIDHPIRREPSREIDAAIAAITAHEIWAGNHQRAPTKDLIRAIRLPAAGDEARGYQALARAEHARRLALGPEADDEAPEQRPAGFRQAFKDLGHDLWHGR